MLHFTQVSITLFSPIMSVCTLCKSPPKIKINVLKYCDVCFVQAFDKKIQKNLRGLPYNSRILILMDNLAKGYAVLESLKRLQTKNEVYITSLENNDLEDAHKQFSFVVATSKTQQAGDCSVSIRSIWQNRLGLDENSAKSISHIIIDNNIRAVFCLKSMEEVCLSIFEKVIDNRQLSEVLLEKVSLHDGVSFGNMFGGISHKEIQYYLYLHSYTKMEYTINGSLGRRSKSLKNFVYEAVQNNPLALFNIINTAKKAADIEITKDHKT